ncbi:MAG: iron-siderophore ABC transporter substrate-binding protein [Chloroflexota bacterium]
MKPTTIFTAIQPTTNTHDLDALARRAPATDDLLELAVWLSTNGATHLSAIARIELAERLITRRRFLIGAGALSLGVITGCGAEEEVDAPTATTDGMRMFDHPLLVDGPVRIPASPERIVALDPFAYELLVLAGQPPLGAIGFMEEFRNNFPEAEELQQALAQTESVGSFPTDVESVVALRPDLILSGAFLEETNAQLQEVAPLLVIASGGSQWKSMMRFWGEALNQTDLVEQLFAAYEARLATLRETVGNPTDITISIIRIREERIFMDTNNGASIVVEDAGFSRPPSQAYTLEESEAQYGNPYAAEISREELQLADGDYIFAWGAYYLDDVATAADRILESPVWQSLNAVQNEQAFQVGEHWIGRAFYGAHAVIDDLFRYVAEVDPQEVSPNPLLNA